MLKNILGNKLRFIKRDSLDKLDIFILETISKNKEIGTLELSKKIGIAPKNLIHRIDKQFRLKIIEKDKKILKPKGWKRILNITDKGRIFIEAYKGF